MALSVGTALEQLAYLPSTCTRASLSACGYLHNDVRVGDELDGANSPQIEEFYSRLSMTGFGIPTTLNRKQFLIY